jgi:N-acetylneuraminate synthase
MKTIAIHNKYIGQNHPVFIIAEAGVNHNGKLSLAKKLVDVAVNSGADAVKFQTFKTENLVTKNVPLASYAKKNIGKNLKQNDLIHQLELPYKDFVNLKQYCDAKKIIFLSTPHSYDAIDFLDDLVPAFKFGSGDITNIPALKHAASKGKPLLLGTGMSTIEEVKTALHAIHSEQNKQIIVLHCTTNYPSPFEEINLRAMCTMQQELDCLVGYSDHSSGLIVPIMATALGAQVIEKHFTLDKTLPGPDHKASLDPSELHEMVQAVRTTETALGSSEKKPTDSETKMMHLVRKSLTAKRRITKGSTITPEMVLIKRPGTGLQPSELGKILGKKAKRNIVEDELFQIDMVE